MTNPTTPKRKYKTMTHPNGHFNCLSDALTEFTDNSIQACAAVKVSEPVIHHSLHLLHNHTSYFSVFDNGCGMDAKGLNDFAIFSLRKEARSQLSAEDGNAPSPSSVNISLSGAGAKKAAFYIGDYLKVVSKTLGDNVVRELIIDLGTSTGPADMFTVKIKERQQGEVEECVTMDPDKAQWTSMMEEARQHEVSHEQFTYLVIRLKPQMRALFENEFATACFDLADMYHTSFNHVKVASPGAGLEISEEASAVTIVTECGGITGESGAVVANSSAMLPPITILVSMRDSALGNHPVFDRRKLCSPDMSTSSDHMPVGLIQEAAKCCREERVDPEVVVTHAP